MLRLKNSFDTRWYILDPFNNIYTAIRKNLVENNNNRMWRNYSVELLLRMTPLWKDIQKKKNKCIKLCGSCHHERLENRWKGFEEHVLKGVRFIINITTRCHQILHNGPLNCVCNAAIWIWLEDKEVFFHIRTAALNDWKWKNWMWPKSNFKPSCCCVTSTNVIVSIRTMFSVFLCFKGEMRFQS